MHGGAADRSGLIHVGDEVIEVNGINVEGKTPGDVLSILVNLLTHTHTRTCTHALCNCCVYVCGLSINSILLIFMKLLLAKF